MSKKNLILLLSIAINFSPYCYATEEKELGIFDLLFYSKDLYEVQQFLKAYPGSSRARNIADDTPLHVAADLSQTEAIKLLLEDGAADVNAHDDAQATPLHKGAFCVDVIRILVRAGANVNAQTSCGETPLHWASLRSFSKNTNECEPVKFLIHVGADIEAQTHDKVTPLHLAAQKGHYKQVLLLLYAGAYVDLKDKDGYTPLHSAIVSELSHDFLHNSCTEAINALLQFGVPLGEGKEIALMRKDFALYEAAKIVIKEKREFLKSHLPTLEKHFLSKEYERLQLSDDLRRLLLDLIVTPALPDL